MAQHTLRGCVNDAPHWLLRVLSEFELVARRVDEYLVRAQGDLFLLPIVHPRNLSLLDVYVCGLRNIYYVGVLLVDGVTFWHDLYSVAKNVHSLLKRIDSIELI